MLVDESAINKKPLVGVARQWNSRLGKIDIRQVGVSTALDVVITNPDYQ